MDYKKTENEIIEATKEFATINNIHYDELTESMILNAMRELNKCFISGVVKPCCDNLEIGLGDKNCLHCGIHISEHKKA